MTLKFITTSDGSHTLYLPEINEQYHSIHGAITESNHVFIKNGFEFHGSNTPKVFEVGFGTGLNCLLTALTAIKNKRFTTYYSIEKFPLKKDITDQLNYGKIISDKADKLFKRIHDCQWNMEIELSDYFKLYKIEADLIKDELVMVHNCDVIYFDAFGPEKQPEMWKPDIYSKIFKKTAVNGVLVTYSAKGIVRRELAASGYEMEKIPGPPGKFQMLRGIKRRPNN